jgi:hypothetical protein
MSGHTRGIVSRRARLTIRLKPVRTARKCGSTWGQSFSRRRGARRSCISSDIVIIHVRFDGATYSFRQARRSNAGMAAGEERSYRDHGSCEAVGTVVRVVPVIERAETLLVPLKRVPRPPRVAARRSPAGDVGATHDRPSITCVAPAAPIDRAGVRSLLRRSRGGAEKRPPETRRNCAHHQSEFATLHRH